MTDLDPALEELRRRVYSPHASEQDRAEYRRLLAAAERPAEEAHAPAPRGAEREPAAPRRGWPARPRRWALGVVAAVALLAGVVALVPRPAPPPAPLATVQIDTPARNGFVHRLAVGGPAGILTYLRDHPLPPSIRDAGLTAAVERWGTGPGTVPLQWDEAAVPRSGRATVLLVAQSSDSAGFTLRTLRPYLRATDPLNLLGARVGALDGGVPAYATFPYESGILPASLHVDVPGGVRWTAAVLLSE